MSKDKKVCKNCGVELGTGAKHGLCDECREARHRQRIEFLRKAAPWIGVGLVIAYGLLSQGAEEDNLLCDTSDDESLEPSDTASSLMDAPEDIFGGQPLSKFDEIAKECPNGLGCTIEDSNFLVFYSTSNSKKTKFATQMAINDDNKLVSYGCHYPGQAISPADIFAKRVNAQLALQK